MAQKLSRTLRAFFPPPRFLSMPTAGIDMSASGVKFVLLNNSPKGVVIDAYGAYRFKNNVINDGDLVERSLLQDVLKKIRKDHHVHVANIALPEQKSYLFQMKVPYTTNKNVLQGSLAQKITEVVPLPPHEARFDAAKLYREKDEQHMAGVAYARRIVAEYYDAVSASGISVRAMESEMHALPRALLKKGDAPTCMIIDFGKTTTKLMIVQDGEHPLFATTLDIGGHALTIAVQKAFGVTEEEAKVIKREKGIVPEGGSVEYLSTIMTTLSGLRDEVSRRFEYWQDRARNEKAIKPIETVFITGGNGSLRGLPEYFMASIGVPVRTGNPFVNLAPFNEVVPPIDFEHSLSYSTAIGLALREFNHD
ncbi:MAG: pilus assembly protein PilM [Patescibacteria group bacterium UBA2103]